MRTITRSFARMHFLEFQIAVTARLAVFFIDKLYRNTYFEGIIERDAPQCGGNNLPVYLRSLWKKDKETLKMQRRQ